MRKRDALEYIIQEFEKYAQQYTVNSIVPDLMKIYALSYDWIESREKVTKEDVQEYCDNIKKIVQEEVFIRSIDCSQTSIWLTK